MIMKKRRILFVGMYPNPPSPYRNVFFQNLIFAIADQGVECTVISPIPVTRYRSKTKLVPKHSYDTTPGGNKVEVYAPRFISASSKQIGSFNTEHISEALFERSVLSTLRKLQGEYDCVYGHFFLYGGLAAIKVGRRLNIPSFVAFGECDYETQIQQTFGDLKLKHIKGLSGVVAVSSKNAKVLDSLGIFQDIPKIIAPNAVDMSLFYKRDKAQCRETLGIPQDQFVVGFVGGFIERKGDKRLLAAAQQLEGVYLAFAGRGEPAPAGDPVVFCRAMTHEEVPILLNAVDVFCLPTLSEGSCNALVEAASCGVPIVSSDLPFNDDLLTEENSIRIDPNSVEAIRNSIGRLKEDAQLRETLSQRIYEDSRIFSIEKRAQRILEFIEKVSVGESNDNK